MAINNHFVYKDVEGATTEWDDLQRKFGNLPPKPEVFKPAPFAPAEDPQLRPKSAAWIDERTPDELEDLEDDDLDDDRFLQEYRRKRLAEMQQAAKVVRYGSVVPISGSDFVREVSQAGQDVWVVVFLYKEGGRTRYRTIDYTGAALDSVQITLEQLLHPKLTKIQECGILLTCLEELATRYPGTKFVKIISTDCIPNYPDRNVPTILVYNNGAVKGTYVGLSQFGARRCTPESVALALCKSDPVLNDGHSSSASKDDVIDGVRRKFIEKLVTQHEDEEEYSSD